jgi:hypothetical protein
MPKLPPNKPKTTEQSLEELLGSAVPSPPAETVDQEGADESDDPQVQLDPSAFQTLDDVPPGAFSDEPPPGFMPPTPRVVGMDIQNEPEPELPLPPPAGQPIRPELRAAPGRLFPKPGHFAPGQDRADQGPDPKYDPRAVSAARASLLEDADRSRALQAARGAPPEPSVPTGAPRRPNADLAVQRALHTHEAASRLASSLPSDQTYRSRVSVSTAYRYDGAVRSAPEFIDRNWMAYDNGGPALNIPNVGLLHVGEWLVIQDILDDDGSIALTEFKIYDDDTFHGMFMPASAGKQVAA